MGAYTYILTNKNNTVLYTGVTSNLERRMWEHKFEPKGFVREYNLSKLVWYESGESIEGAISREKQIKAWKRDWKKDLIKNSNPGWEDLSENWDCFSN